MAVPALAIGSRSAFARGFFVVFTLSLSPLAHAVTAPVGATPDSFGQD
jgi:hypothetical protein